MSAGCCALASSLSAGDGVRSGKSSPVMTKFPSLGSSPKSPPYANAPGPGASREAEAVVEPFPDEAALEPGVALDHVPVLLQAPRAVAHGVAVLAEHVRLVEVGLGAESYEAWPCRCTWTRRRPPSRPRGSARSGRAGTRPSPAPARPWRSDWSRNPTRCRATRTRCSGGCGPARSCAPNGPGRRGARNGSFDSWFSSAVIPKPWHSRSASSMT